VSISGGQPWQRDGRRSGFAYAIGIVVDEGRDGAATVSMPVRDDHLNVGGVVHGGVVCTLIDCAVAVACHSLDLEGRRRAQATTELNVTFLRPAGPGGRLHCTARIRRRGRTLAVGEAEVSDDGGNLVAVGRATYLVGGARPPAGERVADDAVEAG
jgi:uncharacterized protein (TIGR00369 family)